MFGQVKIYNKNELKLNFKTLLDGCKQLIIHKVLPKEFLSSSNKYFKDSCDLFSNPDSVAESKLKKAYQSFEKVLYAEMIKNINVYITSLEKQNQAQQTFVKKLKDELDVQNLDLVNYK